MVTDCKAEGRGTHTDSSANEAGLYAVRISQRTLSDVPAYGNGNQAKPQTWQAEGKFVCVLLPMCLSGICTVRAVRYTHSQQDLLRKCEWWCQPILRVRPCRHRQHSLMRTARVRCAAHYGTITSRTPAGQTNGAYRT